LKLGPEIVLDDVFRWWWGEKGNMIRMHTGKGKQKQQHPPPTKFLHAKEQTGTDTAKDNN